MRVLVGGALRAAPFLDIRDQVTAGSEQGLLSLAFAPDYAQLGRFYVYYTDNARRPARGRVQARVRRPRRRRLGAARAADARRRGQPQRRPAAVRPRRARSTSAPATAAAAATSTARAATRQNLGSLLGKILRIDPRRRAAARPYTVPADNPFVGRDGARARDLRLRPAQPLALLLRPRTGDLSIGDVGQNEVEEIDFVPRAARAAARTSAGAPFEGRSRYAPGESAPGPRAARHHAQPRARLVLDHRRRGRPRPAAARAARALRVRRLLRGADPLGAPARAAARARCARPRCASTSLSSFGEDARGRVYVISLDGPVYRLVAAVSDEPSSRASTSPGVRADNPGPYTLDGHQHVGGRPRPGLGGRPRPGPRRAPRRGRAPRSSARGGAGGIALTHDHLDHVEGVLALRERLGRPPVAARASRPTCGSPTATLGPLEARAVPGHAPDHVAFVLGRRVLHRRRGARRGQRVRRRGPGRLPRRARAPARAAAAR